MAEENQNTQSPSEVLTAISPKNFTFFGSYAHSIDVKGRMIIPNAYRAALGETFTIGPTRDFRAIALYPDAVYDQILVGMMALNQRKPIVQKVTYQFAKLSYREIQPDAQGRVLLPAMLRQRMLGEAKDLEISGALDHIRVVDSALATAEDFDFMENREDILEEWGNLED